MGTLTVEKIQEAKLMKKSIKLPATVNPDTGKQSAWHMAFSEVSWGKPTWLYLKLISTSGKLIFWLKILDATWHGLKVLKHFQAVSSGIKSLNASHTLRHIGWLESDLSSLRLSQALSSSVKLHQGFSIKKWIFLMQQGGWWSNGGNHEWGQGICEG